MPKREPKKCRQWERERRNRLKTQFNGLSKVLPSYDPSVPLSKSDILKGATSYIKELQTLKQKVINGDQSLHDDLKRDLQMLDTRIQKLLNRNEQLVALLQNAGIRIPTELKADKQFCKPKLWSNKITKEKADILAEQVNNAEKENEKTKDTKKVKLKKTKTKNNENKKIKTNKKIKKPLKSKTLKVLHYNNNVGTQNSSSQVLNVTSYSTASSKAIVPYHSNSIQSQTSSIIINNPTITCKNGVTNSTLLSTPIMATGITTDSRSITSLGPGTLILANGNVFPILPGPSPATIIQQPTLLVTNTAPATNQTLLVVGKPPQTNIIDTRKNESTTILKQYPRIAIKRPGITKTTTVNKVPIPALTSKFGRKVIGKENQKKQAVNSKTSTITVQNSDKQSIKRKNTITSPKKCDCVEKETGNQPPEKVPKLIEKNSTEDEPRKDTKSEEIPEKKVPVSNYSVDSLCAKTESSNEEKKTQQDVVKETENSKTTGENNVSSPVTSFLDIPTTSVTVQTSTSTILDSAVSTVSKPQENLSLTLPTQNHSDFSNDLFSTLNIQNRHPESISPTAAFLLAFPLVSTLTGGKTENADDENSESQHDPPTLLQIGNIETKQHTESQISFDNIPNFYTTTVKPKKNLVDPFKPKPKLKGSANILDTINTNTLIPEIPSFQNHIFNYEHTPVTCNKNSKSLPTTSSISFPTSNNSSMEVNYSDIPYSNSTSLLSNSGTVSTSTIDLQITKTSAPYISKITTTNYNNREQFKYPDFKSIPVTSSQKPLVNWMTTPSTTMSDNTTSFLPDFGSGSTTKTKYFKYIEEVGGDSRNYTEEQYLWTSSSTTSVNIAPPSTLPMLMGDLALSTTSTYTLGAKYDSSKDFIPNTEEYYSKKIVKQSFGSNKDQQGKASKPQYSENPPNNTFLSVSQLVDHGKSEQRGIKTSPRKVQAPSLKQHRPSKNEQKNYNCSAGVKEATFSEPLYPNNQNWIKQSPSSNHKNPTKNEQKSYITSHVADSQYDTQSWIKQSTDQSKNQPKNEQKTIERYNCNTTSKESTFVSHVPEISYENQNWMKQSTDSKNLPKSDFKTIESYNCSTGTKEPPFVSHVSNTSYGTQNWIKQSTDKNPPKSDQKTVENYNCSPAIKESPFVSHVTNTTFATQNWLKQSTDSSNHKNVSKSERKTERYHCSNTHVSEIPSFETQNWLKHPTDKSSSKSESKTIEGYNSCGKEAASFVSHVSDIPYDAQNWMKQSTDPSNHKNPPKSEQKSNERYSCGNNKESTFVPHTPDTSFETQNWVKQSTVPSNHKNPPKSEQKPIERYNCGNNKESTFVPQISDSSFETQNWVKQSTDSSNHKNPPKSEQKPIERYNCGNKEITFVPHISDTTFETQNWVKQTESSNNKNVYKNQSKIEHKTVERYYNTQNETQNWMKNTTDSNKHVYKNCSSTYSAEALISGQSSTNYPYSTSKRGYVPTFDPIQPFYNNEYSTPQESTNYYPQNYQNFQNYQEFDDNYNTPSLFSSSGGASNQIKACSKVKDNRKLAGNVSVPCSNIKRTNKRKPNLTEPPPSSGGIGTSTTTLPGFSDLGFLSISSTNSPSLLPTDDPFHVPNLFNTTNNTNSSQIYSQSYSKNQHPDHLIASTYTSSCNLLPPLATSVSLATRNPTLPTTQNIVSTPTAGVNVPSSVGGNSLANFNLSTIFPEINKPVSSSGVYENSTYHQHRAPINNNLPNLIPQQNCGNYTNLQ
ncbi:mucin-5AC-like isoform X2 [Chrysoperla carnea]|uniref:mucin-5AC-like isoform X2 n=1 Tax=Chrysoperla carnea TaxID=189513 RepID=UPI001D0992AE|nr:mucin-5AC-like isoform X2 [Chrysoperla carnea]